MPFSLYFSIPKYTLQFEQPISESKPDTRWKNVESELCSVYINKTTGGFVCPEMSLAGDWKTLQTFLISLCRNRASKRGEPLEEMPVLNKIDFDSDGRVKELWDRGKPMESLDATEFKAVMKYFRLPIRDGPNPEDFALHEVRILNSDEHRLSAGSDPQPDIYVNRRRF